MNEKIKQERAYKLRAIVKATIDHLECGVNALEDANLYTDDVQEHDIDVFVTRLEDIVQEMQDMYNTL